MFQTPPHMFQTQTSSHACGQATRCQANLPISWPRIWANIQSFALSAQLRATLYMLANGKASHGELLFRTGRRTSNQCSFCPQMESLEHKLACCSRVAVA